MIFKPFKVKHVICSTFVLDIIILRERKKKGKKKGFLVDFLNVFTISLKGHLKINKSHCSSLCSNRLKLKLNSLSTFDFFSLLTMNDNGMNLAGASVSEAATNETRDIVLPNQTEHVAHIAIDVKLVFELAMHK